MVNVETPISRCRQYDGSLPERHFTKSALFSAPALLVLSVDSLTLTSWLTFYSLSSILVPLLQRGLFLSLRS